MTLGIAGSRLDINGSVGRNGSVWLQPRKVPPISLALGAIALVSLTALVTKLLCSKPIVPEVCRDTLLSEHLTGTGTVDLQCVPGAHITWKLEAVGETRWVVVTCECATRLPPPAPEIPDASAD